MKGIRLLQQHEVAFNILTTVHAANADYPLEVYRFLRDEVRTQFIQFIPIVERSNNTGYQEGIPLQNVQSRRNSMVVFSPGCLMSGFDTM